MELSYGASRLAIPLSSWWWKYESCEVSRKKIGNKNYPRQSEFFGIDVSNKWFWVLEYKGEAREYKPTPDFFMEAMSFVKRLPPHKYRLSNGSSGLPIIREYPEPSNEVVDFFRKYGPMGIFHARVDSIERTPDRKWQVILRSTPDLVHKRGKEGLVVEYDEYWSLFNQKRRPINPNYTGEEFYRGCQEDWFMVYEELAQMGQVWKWWDEQRDAGALRRAIGQRLQADLSQEGGKVNWAFSFPSLVDAIYGLMARAIVGNVDLRYCGFCGTMYDYKNNEKDNERGRPVYCSPECARKAAEKKKAEHRNTPLVKKKRMLGSRLDRRMESRYFPAELKKRIGQIHIEIDEADSLPVLEEIFQRHAVVFEKLKTGPKT